jgi:hypothetical protein
MRAPSPRRYPTVNAPMLLAFLAAFAFTLPSITLSNAFGSPADAQTLLSQARAATSWFSESAVVCQVELRNGQGGIDEETLTENLQEFRSAGSMRVIADITDQMQGHKSSGRYDWLTADGKRIFYVDGVLGNICTSAENLAKWSKIDLQDPRLAGFLDGNYDFGQLTGTQVSVFDWAQSGSPALRSSTETVDGAECSVVDSDTAIGKISIWIAPSQGYNVAKLQFQSKPSPADQQGNPNGNIPISVTFDNAEFSQQGDRKILVGGRLHKIAGPTALGVSYYTDVKAHRSSVDLNPTFDLAVFTTSFIANGTKMAVAEDQKSGIQYVWQDGKAMPYKDEATLTSIRGEIAKVRAENAAGDSTQPSGDVQNAGQPQSTPDVADSSDSSIFSPWMTAVGIGAGAILIAIAAILLLAKKKLA